MNPDRFTQEINRRGRSGQVDFNLIGSFRKMDREGLEMTSHLTHAVEDYLKTIYEITTTQDRASTNDIAQELGVNPASVTGMLQKLAATVPPLVDYQKHYGAGLTPEGEQVALETVRHHRLIELFLQQILGYPWEDVHEEADRLEHVISEEFEEAIAQALGNPVIDPHGDPIPSRDLQMPKAPSTRLADLRQGQIAVLLRARISDPELLKYLRQLGLVPNARLEITGFSPYDENLSLRIEGDKNVIVLGPKITRQIYVDPAL
jgi:DtxR family transcriptional regulator, Mn-dependent transcriptional regulator